MAALTPAQPSRPLRSRLADYALSAAVLAFAAFLALRLAPDDVAVLPDTMRELISARDCAASSGCSGLGPPSSYLLFHGFIWQRCLSWWMSLGLPLRLLPRLVALLYALSSWLLFRISARLAGRGVALAALAAYWLLAFDRFMADPVWSPGLVAPLMGLFVWCAGTAFLASGRRRTAAAVSAAFVLSLASQAHTEALLFVPGMALFLLLRARPGSRVRAGLGLLGLALVMAAGWQIFSAGSLRINLGIVLSFLGLGPRMGMRMQPPPSLFQPEVAGRFALVAAALMALVWLLRRRRDREPCDGFLAWAAGSYLLGLFPVLFSHDTSWVYYTPVLPLLCVLGARALQEPLGRMPWAAPALAAFLSLAAATRGSPGGNDAALHLGEVESLTRALSEEGYDCNAAFRYLSGGQRAYVDLLYGMWLFAPCLRDVPVLGAAPARSERPVLIAVQPGRPFSPALAPLRPVRVAGRGRDFFLFRLPAYVRLDEFSEVAGSEVLPARGFGVPNGGFGRRCWDNESLMSGLRRRLPAATGTLQFPIRLPRGAGPRTLFLPALEGLPGSGRQCAGRVAAVRGVEAEVSEDRRVLELRGTKKARQGSVTVSWPLDDARCVPNLRDLYALPMLELPSGLFAELRDALE
ncbi:MAG: hypothetical protein NTY77_04670 [Elusimicrobia bacterium]|nr:hypothetical protein [Elusimicrobiota bacterium]